MDPISIATGVIGVIQAANTVLKLCYNLRSATSGELARTLAGVVSGLRDLRAVLERLEDRCDSLDGRTESAFRFLCADDGESRGPLVACTAELETLEATLAALIKSKSKAALMAMGIGSAEKEIKDSLDRIERCKSTLTMALSADHGTLLRELTNTTKNLDLNVEASTIKIDNLASHMSQEGQDATFRAALSWLSPLDPAESQEINSKAQLPGTCGWLLDCWEFRQWLDGSGPPILWLTGSLGTGKTTIFAGLVNTLANTLVYPVGSLAYFYCDFRQAKGQTLQNIMGCLAAQLIAANGELPEFVADAYRVAWSKSKSPQPPAIDLIRSILESARAESDVTLLIDALDECPVVTELAEFLAGCTSLKIRIMATSRDLEEIEAAWPEDGKIANRIRVEQHVREVVGDISAFVSNRLNTDPKFKSLNASTREHVKLMVSYKSNGMFRYAQCQLDSISILRTAKAVKEALDTLPDGLNETYSRILRDIPKSDTGMFRRILVWLGYAATPLYLGQLVEAIAIEPGEERIDPDACLSSPRDILAIGRSLVSQRFRGGRLRLAHLSVRDYLASAELRADQDLAVFALSPKEAHRELAKMCLAYLSFAELATGPTATAEDYARRKKALPLLDYAAVCFSTHLKEAGDGDEELSSMVRNFFRGPPGLLESWVQVLLSQLGGLDFSTADDILPGAALYYAASFGLEDVVRLLLDNREHQDGRPVDIDAPGGRFGGAALHAAVWREHMPVVRLLLEKGASINVLDYNGATPLDFALCKNFHEAEELLRKHGATHTRWCQRYRRAGSR